MKDKSNYDIFKCQRTMDAIYVCTCMYVCIYLHTNTHRPNVKLALHNSFFIHSASSVGGVCRHVFWLRQAVSV